MGKNLGIERGLTETVEMGTLKDLFSPEVRVM